jgi:NADH-quinone oxidoreductase subunit H
MPSYVTSVVLLSDLSTYLYPNKTGSLGIESIMAHLNLMTNAVFASSSLNILLYYVETALIGLLIIVCLLLAVAFFTVLERQLMSAVQRRLGPNVVGFGGLFQAIADGLKLIVKESVFPTSGNPMLFTMAPLMTFGLALIGWSVIPVSYQGVLSDVNLGLLFVFAVSSLAVYGVIIAGWSSNSKYAFLGALRSAAQMISYEVSIGFTLVSAAICSGTFNLTQLVLAQKSIMYTMPLLPMMFLFFVSMLAETNRHPFDLPEAEAELVSGYNVEYSAAGFALFFLGEYTNMLLMSALMSIVFFGGWIMPIGSSAVWMGLKVALFAVGFIVARVAYPRYRYDQLMLLGWEVYLPLSLIWLFITVIIAYGFDGLFSI